MTAAERLAAELAEFRARVTTERILRDGDLYYSTEAGAWDRNSADLDATSALLVVVDAVLAATNLGLPVHGGGNWLIGYRAAQHDARTALARALTPEGDPNA